MREIRQVQASFGMLLVAESMERSHGAATADRAKSRAVRRGDRLLRRLALELTQSSTRTDPDLPPGEGQRLWIHPDGVEFQRVVGHAAGPDGTLVQQWSPRVRYAHVPAKAVVVRTVGGADPRVVARRVATFSVARTAGGQVTVHLETRAGAANRGEEARHSRTIRVTPRNRLK